MHGVALDVVHLRIDSVIVPAVVLAVMLLLGWILLRRWFLGVLTAVTVIGAVVAVMNMQVWRVPTLAAAMGHPPVGAVTSVDIPGTVSGFHARPASIYTPPFYRTDAKTEWPVLVLLTGQPGHVIDWFEGGHLAQTMDAYAAKHDGHAPIVVVADALGDADANPMCIDSDLGNVSTYLAVDVPSWVQQNMHGSMDPNEWAIGGYSYGGTCSVQTALRVPDVYPTFLDISGEDEPRRGSRDESIAAAFGDDSEKSVAQFDAVAPLTLLHEGRFPDTAGAFVVGDSDEEFRPQTRRLFDAAADAGMDVRYAELPGGHSMDVWAPALADEMSWLGERLGL
ncbi:Enterochelin esterase [Rhodococcoides kyotonense]|uniref:Enterochelin esterase n=2 Tax=Rhodococcoides kyotonense TaxID=398843 RepID=A0A239DHU3_9NOCA|nr:Enterochelin esterase [Rhodococcus kyotonensis]